MRKLPLTGKMILSLLAFVVVGLGAATTARADIVVITGVDNTGTDNVLMNPTELPGASTVTGTVNSGLFTVNFTSTSGSGLLTAPASGQARVAGGTGNAPYTQLTFGIQGGQTFTAAVFNINAATDGQFQLTITGINLTGGTFSQTFNVDANGENFFTIHAINGQLMQTISIAGLNNINGNATFTDLRQIRLGGFDVPTNVPEPASMLLFGTGLMGAAAGMRKWFRKS